MSDDAPLILELLADVLRNPTFPEREIERLRTQFTTMLRQSEQDTRSQASKAAREQLYPSDHPYYFSPNGSLDTVPGITTADLAAFAKRYHPAATTIAIVGDIDEATILAEVERWFGDWQGQGEPPTIAVPSVDLPPTVLRREIEVAGKTQSDLVWAVPGLARTDPDFYAAMMANLVLGQLGLMGRLGENVRDKQGLAYYATSRIDADVGAGAWIIYAGINAKNVDRALSAIQEEVDRLLAEGISELERSDSVAYLTGMLGISLEANSGIANMLLNIERYNLGFDYVQRYPEIIGSVTLEQIHAAAKRLLSSERYVIGVAGPAA